MVSVEGGCQTEILTSILQRMVADVVNWFEIRMVSMSWLGASLDSIVKFVDFSGSNVY